MHPSDFVPVVDDLARAANAEGVDVAYYLSSSLDVVRRRLLSADAIEGEDYLRLLSVLPIVKERIAPVVDGYIPGNLLPPCLGALDSMVRLLAEPLAVRRVSEPSALSAAGALLRVVQNAAHSVVLADMATKATSTRGGSGAIDV